MGDATTSERSGWEERKSEMPVGMGEEIVRLAFQSTSPKEWADWLRAPLLGAVKQGNFSSAAALLKAGANSVLEDETPNETMMHAAAEGGNAEIAQALLDHSGEHDVSAGTHTTPLHVAAEKGHAGVAWVLLRAGAKTDGKNWPLTPLHLACRNGHHELAADLLMNGARVNALSLSRRTPLYMAASNGLVEVIKVLMRASADPNFGVFVGCQTALAAAATSGHVHVIRQLVADGAEVDIRRCGYTPLQICMRGHVDLAVAHTLIDLGANVNALDQQLIAPLHVAAKHDYALGVKVLAEAGADIEARNNSEETPLHVACLYVSCDAVNALLQLGADTAALDDANYSPRDLVPSGRSGSDTVLDLLARAPAIRAWYHRGWVLMLRARRLRARAGGEARAPTGQAKTVAGGEGQGDSRDEANGSRKKSGRGEEEGRPVAAAAERPSSAFAGAMSLLLGVEDDEVFRAIILFL